MCRLFETIRVVNGVPQHLPWHEQRMARTRQEYWPGSSAWSLTNLLTVPGEFSSGIVRCIISYGREISDITFKPYIKRIIRSLKIVKCDTLDYHVKYQDRGSLETLLAQRGSCDEILIVKDGLIADTSISNIIFYDGRTWCTPEKPLLKGTCRERLLAEGKITQSRIHPGDISRFTGCKLINAMRIPEEEEIIPVSFIFA